MSNATPHQNPNVGVETASSDSIASQNERPLEALVRYHRPKDPLIRSKGEYSALWIGQCLAMAAVVYLLSVYGGGIYSLGLFSEIPQGVKAIPFSFWLSFWAVGVLAKIFRRGSALIGAVFGEILLEIVFTPRFQPILVVFYAWTVILQSIQPYRGGEFYKADKIFQQIGLLLIIVIGYLPMLYFGYIFGGVEDPEFSYNTARGYLVLIFIINGITPVIPIWGTLWLLDKRLVPFFPLSKEEQEQITSAARKSSNIQEVVNAGENDCSNQMLDPYETYFPQPGELYNDLLTHHPLESDDHTIVVKLGQVRVYLCTRCTGMVFGIFLTLFFTQLLIIDMGFMIPAAWAFWLAMILPLTTIIDWGLQALHIRPAQTIDRFITGFLLGVSMHLLTFARDYRFHILIIVAVYFTVFGILTKIRSKKQDLMDAQNYLTQEVLKK